MPVRRTKDGRWRYRQVVKLPNGDTTRISGSAPRHNNTKAAAQAEMDDHVDRLKHPERYPKPREEVPTFAEWFDGRFWREWVVARKNKPSEQAAKKRLYRLYLKPFFGKMRIDKIRAAQVAQFRAHLVESKNQRRKEDAKVLSEKYINNILAVLSKALRYAEDAELIAKAPKVGVFRVERPEIVAPSFAEYARLVRTAKSDGGAWYVAVALCGEAGLRIGEVKGLRWREDVDLVAGTLTVNQQMLYGEVGTPKGRTRRTIPLTETLEEALRSLSVVREGFVVRNPDGTPIRDGQTNQAFHRLCRKAQLPERGWHWLRHGFGTHSAMLGVNPWRLMDWMGHKRIDETMRYVHVAHAHRRPTPREILDAADGIADPDERILKMLASRVLVGSRGKAVAKRDQRSANLKHCA